MQQMHPPLKMIAVGITKFFQMNLLRNSQGPDLNIYKFIYGRSTIGCQQSKDYEAWLNFNPKNSIDCTRNSTKIFL